MTSTTVAPATTTAPVRHLNFSTTKPAFSTRFV
jgi:hypothetical protein